MISMNRTCNHRIRASPLSLWYWCSKSNVDKDKPKQSRMFLNHCGCHDERIQLLDPARAALASGV